MCVFTCGFIQKPSELIIKCSIDEEKVSDPKQNLWEENSTSKAVFDQTQPCIFDANKFHFIKSIFEWWRNVIKWTTIENENDNDDDNVFDIDDDDRKDQDSAPSQQQNQQRASINLAVNTTHAFNVNDLPRSSRFLCLSSPELPSDANNKAVLTPQPMMRRRHQHRPQSSPNQFSDHLSMTIFNQ